MNKEKDLTIRLEQELKSKIQEKAKELGLSTSAYVRMIIKKEVEKVFKISHNLLQLNDSFLTD